MKLELKHLSPYLPYELKGQTIGYQDVKEVSELTGIVTDDYYKDQIYIKTKGENVTFKDKINFDDGDYKPILIIPTHFKKWIIKDIKEFLEINHNQCMEFLGFMDGEIKLENVTVGLYNAMCKKHIDFQNIISNGLAIDINTLK